MQSVWQHHCLANLVIKPGPDESEVWYAKQRLQTYVMHLFFSNIIGVFFLERKVSALSAQLNTSFIFFNMDAVFIFRVSAARVKTILHFSCF